VSGRHLVAVNFRDPGHPEAGGAELHLEEILAEAVRAGHRVTWLASGFPGGAPESEHRGIRVLRRGGFWSFAAAAPRALRAELASPPPDLVIEDINKVPVFTPLHTRAPVAVIVPHLFGTTAFREAPAPVALAVVALEALIPAVYRRARFLAISSSTRDDLVARGIPGARVAVVECGLDHERYRVDPAVGKNARPTILFVGRVRRYKGLDGLVRALPAVRARVPDARLVVVGDGSLRRALEAQARELSITSSVIFTGFRTDVARLIDAMDVLALPSLYEGMPLTAIEAAAMARPVVATAVDGTPEVVEHGVTGLLVPPVNAAALSAALFTLLADPDRARRMGAAGRRRTLDRFDLTRQVEATAVVYRSVAGGS